MNFCHAHKVRFSYPLGMIFIIIIIILTFFLTSTPVIFNIFWKAVQKKKKEDSFIELKMNFFHADKARFLYLLGILFEFFI